MPVIHISESGAGVDRQPGSGEERVNGIPPQYLGRPHDWPREEGSLLFDVREEAGVGGIAYSKTSTNMLGLASHILC